MTNGIIRVLAPLALLAALLTPAACGSADATCGATSSTTVSVLGPWTGDEGTSFGNVLCEFTRETGYPTVYQGTRAVAQVLQADISKGTPPDVVVLPSPGTLLQYVRKGLVPIDGDLDGTEPYGPLWTQVTSVGGHRYAVVVKAAVKSLIWYDPKVIRQWWPGPMPADWTQLMSLAGAISAHGGSPWCMGTGQTSESGWPATDWIEDIVLHEYGTQVYQDWANGKLSWQDPRIEQAWRQWAALLAGVPGGATSALLTDAGDTGPQMFTNPPGCYLNHEAFIGFYQHFNGKPSPVRDFGYFRFPGMGAPGAPATEVSADLAGAFGHGDGTKSLIHFLASTNGQKVWPAEPYTGVFSIDSKVANDRTVYRDQVTRDIAGILSGSGTLCFDASDLMPPTMSAAFEQALLAVLGDPRRYLTGNGLDSLMASLNTVSQNAYSPPSAEYHCAQ